MEELANVDGEGQEPLSGWPHDEDRVILRFLSNDCRSQVIARPTFGVPPGVRLGEVVDSQLGRFYSLFIYGNTALKGVFSEEELLVIAEVLNGTRFEADILAQGIVFSLRDHLRYYRERVEDWNVDPYQFLANVEALDTLARYALVDVIERWWAMDQEKRNQTPITSLIADAADPERFIHVTI